MATPTYNSAFANDTTFGTLTIAGTVNAGANKILIAGIAFELNPSGTIPTVSTCTWNGVSATKVQSLTIAAGTDGCEMWYLLNPAEGAHNLVCQLSSYASVIGFNAGAEIVNNLQQQGPDATKTATGTGTALASGTLTTKSANSWVADIGVGTGSTITLTPWVPQTARYDMTSQMRLRGSDKLVAAKGDTTTAWTASSSETWGVIASAWQQSSDMGLELGFPF
jgi:hypothetical protein